LEAGHTEGKCTKSFLGDGKNGLWWLEQILSCRKWRGL